MLWLYLTTWCSPEGRWNYSVMVVRNNALVNWFFPTMSCAHYLCQTKYETLLVKQMIRFTWPIIEQLHWSSLSKRTIKLEETSRILGQTLAFLAQDALIPAAAPLRQICFNISSLRSQMNSKKGAYPWHLTESRNFTARFLKLVRSNPPKNGLLWMWFHAWTGVRSPSVTTSGDKLNNFSSVALGVSVYSGVLGVALLGGEVVGGEHTENKCAVVVSAWPLGSFGLFGSPWMWPKHGSSRL